MLRVFMAIALLLMSISVLASVNEQQLYEIILEIIACAVYIFIVFRASEFLAKSAWLMVGILLLILSSLLGVALELNKTTAFIGIGTSDFMVIIDSMYILGLCSATFGLHKIINHYMEHSYYDELTGLSNRRRLKQFESISDDTSLIYIDLDGLKKVNDIEGHHAGDELIVTFANILKALPDTIERFRVGGDEFVLLCNTHSSTSVLKQLNILAKDKALRFSYGEATLSSGLDDAISSADDRMYQMKNRNKREDTR
ncbi:GGDEF domain-containing protein [Vibrio brasiliensis]|uniref:GGDEF domain-containing protein n=1 Tax=Vibrio brasiliensis TaxID=170652 RepID=UPI001EFCAB27|nr:GGDEF domain-containing protein [Vibrio brasiliensis]MCG9648318.1 GGDEF domain-containing protein [Vibrio brasiliensis]